MTLFDYQFVRKFPRRPTLAQGPNAKSHAPGPIGLLDVLGVAGPEAERTYGAAVMDTPECYNGHSRALRLRMRESICQAVLGRIIMIQADTEFQISNSSMKTAT